MKSKASKVLSEAAGLVRGPQRLFPLLQKIASDRFRITFESRHLYSYAATKRYSEDALHSLVRWILNAQRPDGGIAAYHSLLTGYSESYPEVTGYLIPTLYDVSRTEHEAANSVRFDDAVAAAERATEWLMSLQMPSGAFPAGLHGGTRNPSVFNTGQILQGLVRAQQESEQAGIFNAACAAGDWLLSTQHPDGFWSGPGAYQNTSHTYYSMVAWALAELSELADQHSGYGVAADKNLDWVLSHFRLSGWVDGINLRGHPIYLHFVAYVLQGVLECGILRRRNDAIDAVTKSAWVLLRKFETNKFLPGAYEADFRNGSRFACLTGNAQMSCVWLRLYEITGDLRYLNAALKMNEMLKELLPTRGPGGVVGGLSGSYPIWGRYQPLRYISWGCKFFADALLLERRVKRSFAAPSIEALPCAS